MLIFLINNHKRLHERKRKIGFSFSCTRIFEEILGTLRSPRLLREKKSPQKKNTLIVLAFSEGKSVVSHRERLVGEDVKKILLKKKSYLLKIHKQKTFRHQAASSDQQNPVMESSSACCPETSAGKTSETADFGCDSRRKNTFSFSVSF